MMHPVWSEFLPKLREELDNRGLKHIAIKEETEGEPLTYEELESQYGTSDLFLDEYVTFEPVDAKWRTYRVEGAPKNDEKNWIGRAELDDFQNTPMISYEVDWEMRFGYDQGTLPPDVFEDESEFLQTVVDYLTKHFADRNYLLGVSVQGDTSSWGRRDTTGDDHVDQQGGPDNRF